MTAKAAFRRADLEHQGFSFRHGGSHMRKPDISTERLPLGPRRPRGGSPAGPADAALVPLAIKRPWQ